MNAIATAVQLSRNARRGSIPGMSVDPLAQHEEEPPERLTVDLRSSDARFLERFAAYRNALNQLEGRKVRPWTRKSAAEAFVAAQVRQVVENMALAFRDRGELPAADDEKAMLAYAKAVLASADKSNKKR